MVKYEELVTKKEEKLKEIMEFLNLDWQERLLNHQDFIDDKVVLSKMEWSNDQINRSIYTDSLDNWVGKVPGYDEKVIRQKIKMLDEFGYNN